MFRKIMAAVRFRQMRKRRVEKLRKLEIMVPQAEKEMIDFKKRLDERISSGYPADVAGNKYMEEAHDDRTGEMKAEYHRLVDRHRQLHGQQQILKAVENRR